MGNTLELTPAQHLWKAPDVEPTHVGEYRAALSPAEASIHNRRWWNGRSWSNPYHASWPEALKERYRKEISLFSPYWMANE